MSTHFAFNPKLDFAIERFISQKIARAKPEKVSKLLSPSATATSHHVSTARPTTVSPAPVTR